MMSALVSVIVLMASPSVAYEPCDNFTTIGDEKRSVRYIYNDTVEKPLRERIIDENIWYSFEARTGGEIPEKDQVDVNHCGTDSPIYIKRKADGQRYHDTAKTNKTDTTAIICANYGDTGSPCSWNSTIVIRYCEQRSARIGKDVFVYKLRRPERCEVSYCAGELEACPPGYVWSQEQGNCSYKISPTVEPCTDFINITDVRRSVKYAFNGDVETAVCDNAIDEDNWYFFGARTGSEIPEKEVVQPLRCGTESPIFIKESGGDRYHDIAKRTAEDTNAIVCANYGIPGNRCSWNSTIVIRYCQNRSADLGKDTFVYKLRRPPGCSVAYCAGEFEVCPSGLIWNEDLRQCFDPSPTPCDTPSNVPWTHASPKLVGLLVAVVVVLLHGRWSSCRVHQ